MIEDVTIIICGIGKYYINMYLNTWRGIKIVVIIKENMS